MLPNSYQRYGRVAEGGLGRAQRLELKILSLSRSELVREGGREGGDSWGNI